MEDLADTMHGDASDFLQMHGDASHGSCWQYILSCFKVQRMICTALRTDEAGLTMSKYIREATEMMDRVSDAKSRGMVLG